LYWPALDVDVAVESLDHPERYPLMSPARSTKQNGRPEPGAAAPGGGKSRRRYRTSRGKSREERTM